MVKRIHWKEYSNNIIHFFLSQQFQKTHINITKGMKEHELLNFVLQLNKSRGAYTISTFAVFTRFWLNREWEKEQISVFVSLPSLPKWMMLSRWHKHQTQSNVYRVKHNSEKRQVQLFCHTFDFVVMNLNLKADIKFWKVIICLWEMWILNSILDKALAPP